MKRRTQIRFACAATLVSALMIAAEPVSASGTNVFRVVSAHLEPPVPGRFAPTWDSLRQYQCPEWFKDAKFGIWAHWGAQCEPEQGDWYARFMYWTNSAQYKFHLEHYGSPKDFGFKDVIHEWKAQNWDPDKLLALYKRAGAQYFMALANHHDNFDNWDSKYQPWNSTQIGPHKDLIGGWAAAARKQGLHFGVSVHAAHAWMWYEPAQDFDGNLTRADGKGKWWDGLDPQDLYAQSHPPSLNCKNANWYYPPWEWVGKGVSIPDQAYCQRFYNRTMDLIQRYHPDLIYFDDMELPLWPISDAGLKLAANFYNLHNQWHGTNDDGVLFGKALSPSERPCMVPDLERKAPNGIEPLPFQSDTCIGGWHYDRALYDRNGYTTAPTVIQMLCDLVSKNGNLLLSIPVRADGTIDDKEQEIVEAIGDWMAVNRECIFNTKPWKVFGEGPAAKDPKALAQGFAWLGAGFTASDVRFTQTKDGKVLYAIVLGAPAESVRIESLGDAAGLLDQPVRQVQMLGGGMVAWRQTADALVISQPEKLPQNCPVVFKLVLEKRGQY
ncbi:MAG TPA: alpha-L-fucosidase [Candidatus Acidoferrum sp.]|nr:alpha-L-fucosidase [Candidatus Acidoferrum sp.]